MDTVEWPLIPARKVVYTTVMFPMVTSLLLFGQAESSLSMLTYGLLHAVHFAIISVVSHVVIKKTYEKVLLLDTPLLWRYVLTATYSATPFVFNIGAYILFFREPPGPFAVYANGLLCIFGGITAILMTKEIPEGPPSLEYLEKIYGETLQLVWPYTFSFVLMLVASPFVASQLQQGVNLKSLLTAVSVGMIGFITLIVMPLSNLSDLRRAIYKLQNSYKDK